MKQKLWHLPEARQDQEDQFDLSCLCLPVRNRSFLLTFGHNCNQLFKIDLISAEYKIKTWVYSQGTQLFPVHLEVRLYHEYPKKQTCLNC